MIPKTEIYYASRKTSSAHVFITKGVGKIRINNIPLEMIEPESSREVILAPLEIIGEEIREREREQESPRERETDERREREREKER